LFHRFRTTIQVARAAEYLASTMGVKLSLDRVLNNINPLISTGDYPANQLAIKMMTKVAEAHPSAAVLSRLDDVMPALIQAYDSDESSVRKAAVFCMVALHNSVGQDALRPYLATLNGSKLKLLNLYIKRAQSPGHESSSRASPAGANF
jgi:CLIP-associating protein 1/2